MAGSRTEILVGAVVLAAAVGFVVYTAQATGARTGGGSYALNASFRSLEGVSVGTDIRLAGVKIGTVSDVRLNQETYRADMVLAIRDGILIPDDSAAVIASEGLLGGTFVEIDPGGSPFTFDPGAEILDTQGAVSLISLLLRFVTGKEGQ
ncbi:outer membrane lipid asymmetry maintenance protein MlaD [Pseudaestuariivita atlantica]|uniref:ABC transporter substrate-binding protein n=1 Tax=Pseudaestuariivita atlantica TaxID=1317121 RepID=A0A0L1JLK4_9RHOB|nr:outer membrane lipid asymmetry maintenance protein MlaD [Pseudaestuariivita atlantica]KNG92630.1 ABC transporter substrate-binding protein [Pseudaestuariivita atlantica]